MFGLFVLFPPRRYIWETFCNFWHFSGRIFFFFQTVGDLFCLARLGVGGAVGLRSGLCPRLCRGRGPGGEGKVGHGRIYCIFSFSLYQK